MKQNRSSSNNHSVSIPCDFKANRGWPSVCVCGESCPTLCDPVDCSLPGSSVREILQARIVEWVAISSSRGSSWPRDQTHVSCIGSGFFIVEPLRADSKLKQAWCGHTSQSREHEAAAVCGLLWWSVREFHYKNQDKVC